jgi:hypothetical protein
MALEADIDDLYKKPLGEFTAARNALAKSLAGDAAKRVKSLAKPTVVAWAVNQLYWHARPAYTKVMAAGEALREAQIAALGGKAAKVSKAAEAHRTAVAAAVREGVRLAAEGDAHPNADEVGRTLEALSLAAERPPAPGRLTEAIAPAGFEALAGMTLRLADAHSAQAGQARSGDKKQREHEEQKKAFAEARRRELQREITAAERDLERAQQAETSARERLERATEERRRAETALAALNEQLE